MFIIEKPFKTIIRREGKHLLFSLLFFSIITLPVFAQMPSFEIYPSGGHSEPDIDINIENGGVHKTNDIVTIRAKITDVSSIYSAGVIIKDSAGNQKETQLLYDDGNHQDDGAGDSIYGALILIDSYPLDTFTVDFFATDVFGNRAILPNAGSFITGGTLPGYSYRRKITIQNDQIKSDLANFPLLVSIPSAIADKMADTTDWNDIRFTGSDGLTLLTYEKESMSASGGKYWVKVSDLYASPVGRQNQIFVYYGKAGDIDGSDPTNVWDSSFKSVWHMHNASSPATDSTLNANNGTQFNGVTFGATGKINSATSYPNTTDYLQVNDSNSLDLTGNGTISVLVKTLTLPYNTTDYELVFKRNGSGTNYQFFLAGIQGSGHQNELGLYNGNSIYWSGWSIAIDSWYQIAIVRTGANSMTFYVNGMPKNTVAANWGTYLNSPLYIGGDGNTVGGYNKFPGILDELRISNIARSAEWIKFEYANVFQTDNELTWGGEEEL